MSPTSALRPLPVPTPDAGPNAPVRIVADDLTLSHGNRTVLDGVDLAAGPGRRIGVIGENGTGKSTLLRVLAGTARPDRGSVRITGSIGLLAQEPALDGTVRQVMTGALAPLHEAVADIERLSARMVCDPSAADELADRLEWATAHDAWDADRRAAIVLDALGLSAIDPDRPAHRLSGGERTRVALAALLVARPDCLLLDEPTNHLDAAGLDLLESQLLSLPGVVIAASHDRAFLDRVCTDLLDLDPQMSPGERRFSSSFTRYLEHRAAARRRWEQTYAEQQDRIAALRQDSRMGTDRIAPDRGPRDNDKFIHHFKGARVERTHARRVRLAERRLAEAERSAVPAPPVRLSFTGALTATARDRGADQDVVRVRGLRIAGRVTVDELALPAGGRLLLTGANGSGKSSLLLALAGRLGPADGAVRVHADRIGLLEQDVAFADPELTARATFGRAVGQPDDEASLLVDVGLLRRTDLDTPVGGLSVGQRRRLGLGLLVARPPDLLLLDEPTNHLSLTLAADLEEALGAAPGTVIVASHDRWLRGRWTGAEYRMAG
ncbi:ABC-F family ATP-binding cassette domain-containing protein [Nakamurella sp.]|uniref:ABC-F family ATP-binding cassette domain-containing protein n=1 Tax=Nakamurella sp. TaxID=1869182 RepID=UPI003B3BE381